MLVETGNGLLATLFAPWCASCTRPLAAPLDGPVCSACWRAVKRLRPPLCELCGDPLNGPSLEPICPTCRLSPRPLRTRAAGLHEGTLRAIVHALKYEQRRSLARPLAALVSEAAGQLLDGVDGLVPVPLHWWRHWRRGFNQADELARQLARARGIPVHRLLLRRRATRPQSELDADGRQHNVAGAFALAGRTRRTRAAIARQLQHRVLVLVDDVATTGATLAACAATLREAGAADVRAVTIARVVLPPLNATGRRRRRPEAAPHRAPRRYST